MADDDGRARLDALRTALGESASAVPEGRALVEVAMLMASADGRLDPAEAAHVADTIGYLAGLEIARDEVEKLVRAFCDELRETGWEAMIDSVAARIEDRGTRRNAYRLAAAVALVDGWIHRDEAQLFTMLASAMSIPADEASRLLDEVRGYMDGIDETTGVYPKAT